MNESDSATISPFDISVNLHIGILGLLVKKTIERAESAVKKNRKWILRPRKFIIFVFLPL